MRSTHFEHISTFLDVILMRSSHFGRISMFFDVIFMRSTSFSTIILKGVLAKKNSKSRSDFDFFFVRDPSTVFNGFLRNENKSYFNTLKSV